MFHGGNTVSAEKRRHADITTPAEVGGGGIPCTQHTCWWVSPAVPGGGRMPRAPMSHARPLNTSTWSSPAGARACLWRSRLLICYGHGYGISLPD
eukprot:6813995-Prymnesium_polylepis.1